MKGTKQLEQTPNVVAYDPDTQVFATVEVEGKPRRVRFFGPITVHYANGPKQIIQPAHYMFIKNEPKTVFSHDIKEIKKFTKPTRT